MIFLFHSWDMLFPRRVTIQINIQISESMYGNHVWTLYGNQSHFPLSIEVSQLQQITCTTWRRSITIMLHHVSKKRSPQTCSKSGSCWCGAPKSKQLTEILKGPTFCQSSNTPQASLQFVNGKKMVVIFWGVQWIPETSVDNWPGNPWAPNHQILGWCWQKNQSSRYHSQKTH